MLLVPERARADAMFCAERAYYHFATVDTSDDGDLPGPGEDIEAFAEKLFSCLDPQEGDESRAGSAPETEVRVFVDNVERKLPPITAPALGRLTSALAGYDDALSFFSYFQ